MVSLVCGVFNGSQNVLSLEKRVVGKNLLERCSRCQQFQDVGNPHPQTSDAGASSALSFFHCDSLQALEFHGSQVYARVLVIARSVSTSQPLSTSGLPDYRKIKAALNPPSLRPIFEAHCTHPQASGLCQKCGGAASMIEDHIQVAITRVDDVGFSVRGNQEQGFSFRAGGVTPEAGSLTTSQ